MGGCRWSGSFRNWRTLPDIVRHSHFSVDPVDTTNYVSLQKGVQLKPNLKLDKSVSVYNILNLTAATATSITICDIQV
jgi:hypothetical protein